MNTKPEEFEKFHMLLMGSAPDGYMPWYFPVQRNGKNPDHNAVKSRAPMGHPTPKSWKAEHARLTFEEAKKRLSQGGNVGICARADDPLILIDIDDVKFLDTMPLTLIIRSRKRNGLHGYCWMGDSLVKNNNPTEHGEMRCIDQYVLASGSAVEVTDEDLEKWVEKGELTQEQADLVKQDTNRGVYTVETELYPITILFKQLPAFFREEWIAKTKKDKELLKLKGKTKAPSGKHSTIFDLKMSDIVSNQPGRRYPHPLHISDTGQNFSIDHDGGLCHCWRHTVSLNAIQFLCVKAGYVPCQKAGTPHKVKGKRQGVSQILGDYGAIFYAWREAKKMNLIPINDPIPVKAMIYIAKKEGLVTKDFDGILPAKVYNKIVRMKF